LLATLERFQGDTDWVKESVGIARVDDERGLYYRALHLEHDGRLVIEGHDLGSCVGKGWGDGSREYRFIRHLTAECVAQLRVSAGNGDQTLLSGLQRRLGSTADLERHLNEHGIESRFWSRGGE